MPGSPSMFPVLWLKWRRLTDTDARRFTSAPQLHHWAILIPPGDRAAQSRRPNLVDSKFSVIQGRRTFQAKQKIRATNFHTYWSGLFEKPLMKPETEFWGYATLYKKQLSRMYNTYVLSMEQCGNSCISQLRGQITEFIKCVTTPWIMGYMTHAQPQRLKNRPRCDDILKLILDIVRELSRRVQQHQHGSVISCALKGSQGSMWDMGGREGGVVSPPGAAPLCHGWTECGWCCAAPAASHLVHLPITANFELLHICCIRFTFSAHERPTLNKESSAQQQPPPFFKLPKANVAFWLRGVASGLNWKKNRKTNVSKTAAAWAKSKKL